MRLCPKNVGCVCLGEERRGLENFKTGGKGISMIVMQILQDHQVQWMRPVCMVTIFQRSVEKHSFRYVEFLGDGDSKAHNSLSQETVYGDITVEKLECVGHVQKHLGSRLRALKKKLGKTPLEDGKSIGGTGRLTDKRIDKLQVYYGKDIRENTHDVNAMRQAVMAIWHHTKSTDEDPDHDLCPPGADSWCGSKR